MLIPKMRKMGGICLKRRLAMFICLLALFAVMALPVCAQSTASRIDSFCTINADGDCLVNMTVTLHLENASEHLRYPLPPTAEDITVNKGSARVEKTPAASMVDLSKFVAPGMTGDISIQFDYTVPGIVTVDEELVEKEEKRLKQEKERQEKENQ